MIYIEWCNNNLGFVSMLLSALTLLVSIFAVIVSINTARLPYKKKLLLVFGSYISVDGGIGLHITTTNIGNRNIRIKTIGFLIGNLIYVNKKTLFDSQITLSQGETTSQYFNINDMKTIVKGNRINRLVLVYAFVEDTEGKRYKKRLGTVDRILKLST